MNRPWTDTERLVLIRCTREMIPELAGLMKRSLGEVTVKFLQLHEIFEQQYASAVKKYISWGFMPDEAYEKVAYEVDIDFDKIRDMEEHRSTIFQKEQDREYKLTTLNSAHEKTLQHSSPIFG
jgi:hypothetical protein